MHQVYVMSLVSPSLWITPVKISASGLLYVTGVTFLMDNTSELSASGLMYVTGVTVTGVTFLMDNTSEDQCIRSYVCHWCHLPYG